MKRVGSLLAWLVVLVFFGVGVSVAYFTFVGKTTDTAFMTGKMELELAGMPVDDTANWMPGKDKVMEYTLSNYSTSPLQAKAYSQGSWDDEALDPSVVTMSKIERFDGTTWVPITLAEVPLGDEVLIQAEPSSTEPMVIEPDEEVKLRVSYRLGNSVDTEYQDAILTTALHVAGKQAIADASWPASY